MTLLYISLWSIKNGLTQSTVLPVVHYLVNQNLVERVILCTPEMSSDVSRLDDDNRIIHVPLTNSISGNFDSGLTVIFTLFFGIGRFLFKNKKQVGQIWARGSVAGGVASLLFKFFRIPFSVESFEPHSEYMVESGAWSKSGTKYRIQKRFESAIIKSATNIITVSQHFTKHLEVNHGLKNVHTIPCSVEFDVFGKNIKKVDDFKLPTGTIGIYIGKFGDIYYNEEFFDLIQKIINDHPEYFQIILTPMVEDALNGMEKRSIDPSRYHIQEVSHDKIPSFLNIADIAFCPVKQTPSKIFCSPVKTAEYLALGLPIIISKAISDDSDFINDNNLGLVIDFEAPFPDIKLDSILEKASRAIVIEKGRPYRDSRINFQVYNQLF